MHEDLPAESQNNGADNPIVWLITWYLLVNGGLGTIDFLLSLVPPEGWTYRYVVGTNVGCEYERVSYFSDQVLELGMLAAGVWLWYRPSWCVRLLCFISTLAIIASVLKTFHWRECLAPTHAVSAILPSVGFCVAAICVLGFLHRGLRATCHVLRLAGCILLVVGLFHLAAESLTAESSYGIWRHMSWHFTAMWLAGPYRALVWIGTGAWLLLFPRRLAVSLAVLLVCASILYVIARWLPTFAGLWNQSRGGIEWIRSVVFQASFPLTALVFLCFVLRYKHSLKPDDSKCSSCGYLLYGLPTDGHNCPECGQRFERKGGAP